MKNVLEAKSKGKKTEVLFILVNNSACKENLPLPAYSKLYGLSQSDVLAVVNFYSEDEVSQISPNKKEDSIA